MFRLEEREVLMWDLDGKGRIVVFRWEEKEVLIWYLDKKKKCCVQMEKKGSVNVGLK
jgi:hypothetical protein